MKIELSCGELRSSPLSLVDEAGRVFFWKDRILRGIPAGSTATMRALLASGLLDALAERGWAPRCREIEVTIPGFDFVVEQDRLPVVAYPYEWTYGMLRDAAARVLEINGVARAYGWELKDSHGFNVVFNGTNPMWVDLGSFVPCAKDTKSWPGLEDFMRFYWYTLSIWSHGGGFIARRLLAAREFLSHAEYGLYRWPFLRLAGVTAYQKALKRWYQAQRLPRALDDEVRTRLPVPLASLAFVLRRCGWLPGQVASQRRLRTRIQRCERRGLRSPWSDYQIAGAASVATPRFRRIIELLRRFQVKSVVELGGNQGWLSEQLLRERVVESSIATDADELAVDRGYERAKQVGCHLNMAVLDFVFPMVHPSAGEPPEERFRSEAVLALAVTHHLLLSQGVPIDRMLRTIGAYAQRIVFVEFMPLGLSDGRTAPPVPSWYTTSWFRDSFRQEFVLTHEELLESNRHLFCGLRKT